MREHTAPTRISQCALGVHLLEQDPFPRNVHYPQSYYLHKSTSNATARAHLGVFPDSLSAFTDPQPFDWAATAPFTPKLLRRGY